MEEVTALCESAIQSAPDFSTARRDLLARFSDRIEVNGALNRARVSYQSNRNCAFYRWFKYKEGFSAALVDYFLQRNGATPGTLLDPFAGSGVALFESSLAGWQADGIELMPVGSFLINTRIAAGEIKSAEFAADLRRFRRSKWRVADAPEFSHLTITKDAFAPDTERDLTAFRHYARSRIADPRIAQLFDLACLSVLEQVSYTRKDGQYLRWDSRSPRNLSGKPFCKGEIPSFETAIEARLEIMAADLAERSLFIAPKENGSVRVETNSCLHALPDRAAASVDLVITSPPYCNRYDYTRTYALELAYLGIDGEALKKLRQSLLSCTVENRSKLAELRTQYGNYPHCEMLDSAMSAFENSAALQEVLSLLDEKSRLGELNNPNLARMVRNYFLESAVVIFELARVLRAGGHVYFVNDNVQYGGEEVPVDLILCEIAAEAGLQTEVIWMLGRGKGNSSQQMGVHGRRELRKCVYVWRKA